MKIIDERMTAGIHPDKNYRVFEVVNILNVSTMSVYNRIKSGELRSINVGAVGKRASYRVPGWALIDYIKERCTEE